ncbi:hypothetical protein ACJX0J_006854, partial [Zea mays]
GHIVRRLHGLLLWLDCSKTWIAFVWSARSPVLKIFIFLHIFLMDMCCRCMGDQMDIYGMNFNQYVVYQIWLCTPELLYSDVRLGVRSPLHATEVPNTIKWH